MATRSRRRPVPKILWKRRGSAHYYTGRARRSFRPGDRLSLGGAAYRLRTRGG